MEMRFISTYIIPYEFWQESVHPISRFNHSTLNLLRRLVLEAPDYEAAILHGAVPVRRLCVDLVAAALVARRGTPVLLADATWEPGSRSLTRHVSLEPVDTVPSAGSTLVRRVISTLDTPRTHYGVFSTYERDRFPALWGVAPERVHFTPFCAKQPPKQVEVIPDSVFAGGNSLRDYRPLIAATPHIRGQVRIATNLAAGTLHIPSNLAFGSLEAEAYASTARTAAVVVVPLIADSVRSAGQQTYLDAMLQGQPVVVTDAPGVRDYIEDGRTGLIVPPGDDIAMAFAVNRLLDDPDLARRIGGAAHEVVARNYKVADYFERLLVVAGSLRTS